MASVLSFLVMIVLAIVSFYFTVFVVSAGASFAGYNPSADYVVLSASLLVVGAILSGGLSPVLFLSKAFDSRQTQSQETAPPSTGATPPAE